ncbi:hypothetical protein [Hymenobacter sp.]|jgi:chaperone modulatory protein CbpM|uniref:hypothetical protein n=1 Tax=Hymenobacter sp. TaxID=1898978 RepID=UPI002EDA38E1
MKTHIIRITYHDCALRYGLSEADLRGFADLGLLATDSTTDTIHDEPEHLARLARLQHELGLSKEGIDVVLAMRQRLLSLQHELMLQRARARQFEHLLGSTGPTLDADDWL